MRSVRFVRRFAESWLDAKDRAQSRRKRDELENGRVENGGGVEDEERIEWERMLTAEEQKKMKKS